MEPHILGMGETDNNRFPHAHLHKATVDCDKSNKEINKDRKGHHYSRGWSSKAPEEIIVELRTKKCVERSLEISHT